MSGSSKNKKANMPKGHIKVRPFPYPFKAALAICSDIDGCDRETFLDVHRFLNIEGSGLGLPVSDSFFAVGREPRQMAYFRPDGFTHSDDADFIQRSIQDGLVDSIHSWGDFNATPPDPLFLRELAKRLTKEFQDLDLTLKVWINHGSSNNYQNLYARLQSSYRGSDAQSPFYTLDLLQNLGIKYYWWSEIVPWPLSAQAQTPSARLWWRLNANCLKNVVKFLLGRSRQCRTSAQFTELALPLSFSDNTQLMAFSRFNFSLHNVWTRPTRHTMRSCLAPHVLQELIKRKGYLIIYTHLGLPQPRVKNDPVFPDPDKEALMRLADLFRDGIIWVTPTQKLLTYWLMWKYLVWDETREGEKTVVTLLSIDDPTTGPRLPDHEELMGLCFYTDDPEKTIVRVGKHELSTDKYPSDESGRRSIGLPVSPPPCTKLLN